MKANVPKVPGAPSREEISQHEASGHAVHRTWCVHCTRARGTTNPHASDSERKRDESALPEIHLDYFFLGKDPVESAEADVMPHLVARDTQTKRVWATSVPQKGVHEFSVHWLSMVIRESGWRKLVLFSDNEFSLVALKQKVLESLRDVEIHLKESPTSTRAENAPANGIAESAVREVKRTVRAMLSDLELKLGEQIDPNHPILAWIARHAAFLMTRFRMGPDGKSAYERSMGRPWRRPTIVLGEESCSSQLVLCAGEAVWNQGCLWEDTLALQAETQTSW